MSFNVGYATQRRSSSEQLCQTRAARKKSRRGLASETRKHSSRTCPARFCSSGGTPSSDTLTPGYPTPRYPTPRYPTPLPDPISWIPYPIDTYPTPPQYLNPLEWIWDEEGTWHQRYPTSLWTEWHTYENITFPQLRWPAVTMHCTI